MKKIILTIIILIPLISFAGTKQRFVELSWEATTGAVSYEVEVTEQTADGNKVIAKDSVYSFTWRKKLPSGKYAYRLRSLDYRKVPGPWSQYIPFFVNLPSVNLVRPYENEVIEGIDRKRLDMLFAWGEVLGARYYLLEILNSKGKSIYRKIHSETKVFVSLKTSRTYSWRVEALRKKSDPIPPPTNTRALDIKGPPLKAVTITLKQGRKAILFKWNKSPGAKNYSHHLYQKLSGKWIKIRSKKNVKKRKWLLKTKKLKSTTYKFIVDAYAPGRSSSKRSAFVFTWTGDETKDHIKKLEEPLSISSANQAIRLTRSPYEAYVSFSTPTGEYTGYEDTSLSELSDKLTAQRFGAGFKYTTPNKNTIWSLAFEMDNFINSKSAWQLYVTDFRHEWYWGDKYRIDIGLGLFYKQSPLISLDLVTNVTIATNVTTVGPNSSFKFRYRISETWFFEYEALMRMHLLGLSLPEGELEPGIELMMTFKIIYRYGELIDFMFGFESSDFDISYSSTRTGKLNNVTTSLSGLYAGVTIPF